MKTYFYFTALLLSVTLSATAHTPKTGGLRRADGKSVQVETRLRDSLGLDSMRRLDTMQSELVQLRSGSDRGEVVMEVAGFGLTFGQTPMQRISTHKPRISIELLSDMEFGFTQLVGTDYAGYTPEQQGFLDQKLGGSFHFSFSIGQLSVPLNRKGNLRFKFGMQYTLDNYRLSNTAITLGNELGRVVPVALDKSAKKSKMVTSSLGIPLRLTYRPVKKLRLTAVAYNDFMLGADAIYKKPKEKNSLSELRVYQFGLGASATYHGLGIYMRYGLTPLFKQGAAPKCHPLSFGVAWSFCL